MRAPLHRAGDGRPPLVDHLMTSAAVVERLGECLEVDRRHRVGDVEHDVTHRDAAAVSEERAA